MTDEQQQQWRVLCADASVLLISIRETAQYNPDLVDEWQRRFRMLAAENEAERERIERTTFKPCRHCQTFDEKLEIRRQIRADAEQGIFGLLDFCGCPLDFVPLSMRSL